MKKVLALFLALVMLFIFAACGAQDPKGGKTENQGSSSLGKGSSDDEIVVTFWRPINQESEELWYQKMVDDFNAQNKGKIRVEATAITRGDSFAYEDKLSSAAATDSLPDILMVDGPNIANYAYSNMLIPLDDFLTEDDRNDFLPSIMQQGTYQDKFWAVGLTEGTINIFYNKDMFRDAGIPEPPSNPDDAWTWGEFYDIAKKLTKDGVYGSNFIQEKSGEWIIVAFMPFLVSNGVEFLSEDSTTADGYINSPAAVETAEYLKQFATEGLINVDPTPTEFQEGKSATKLAGAWLIPGLEDVDFEWGITFVPQNKQLSGSTSGGWSIGISPASKNTEAAWAFIDFLTNTKGSASMSVDGSNAPPTRLSSFDLTPVFSEYPYSVIKDTLVETGYARPVTPNYPIYTQKFSEAFYDILLGADVKSALDDIAQSYDTEYQATYGTK
jgi:fructooligosaccharide transport system substrate-binding protein